ncbi:MAG: hypothetical protein ABI963_13175 [Rhizomicrobium sp.]
MAPTRIEIKPEELPPESHATHENYEARADKFRQESGHLPPQDDQSWREMEALRIAAYEKTGHLPPQDDQSWREREAMRFVPAQEKRDAYSTPDIEYEQEEYVQRPVSTRRGRGGIILAFFTVAALAALVAVALVFPDMLRADFWRTPEPAVKSKVEAVRTALPAAPAPAPSPAAVAQPVPPPAPPVLIIHADSNPPPVEPAKTAVPEAKPTPPAMRPTKRDQADDRSARGFYAKVPGPDGTLKDTYFPSKPTPDSRPAKVSKAGNRSAGGFYAKVPGPNGTLEDKFFPSTPSR